jgi:hypothetical protein
VAKTDLAQVVDPASLDTAAGARARLRVVVLEAWAREQADIEIAAPARLACARCDGGGCDGCARSGAHRAPAHLADRTLQVRLPDRMGDGVALRLIRPFGDASPLDQLLVEIVTGAAPSPGVTRLPPAAPPRPSLRGAAVLLALLAVLATVAAVLATR